MQGNVRFPHRLCAAADKNGEGIGDPTEHLTAYTFKVRFTKQLNQTTVDQFGTLKLDVVRPDFLMVPTAKNGVPITPPVTDHFTCYKVKPSRGAPKFVKRTVTVADQFETITPRSPEASAPVCACQQERRGSDRPQPPGPPPVLQGEGEGHVRDHRRHDRQPVRTRLGDAHPPSRAVRAGAQEPRADHDDHHHDVDHDDDPSIVYARWQPLRPQRSGSLLLADLL